jgi:hypothetical protein
MLQRCGTLCSIFADHAPVDAVSQQRAQLSSPPKMRSPNSLSPQQQAMKVHPARTVRDMVHKDGQDQEGSRTRARTRARTLSETTSVRSLLSDLHAHCVARVFTRHTTLEVCARSNAAENSS